MTAPDPGIYPDVPPEEYHSWDLASNSGLTAFMRSPAHYRVLRDEERPETDALRVGRATHIAVLEPERFSAEYAFAGPCEVPLGSGSRKGEPCGSSGSLLYADGTRWACRKHARSVDAVEPDSAILSEADHEACLAIRDAVHATKAKKMLTRSDESVAELSIVWDDERTGVRCKGRLDWHTLALPGGVVVDLKTTRDASRLEFERSIFQYGYHRQAAMYLSGCRALGIPADAFVIVAVEKVAPYGVGIYRLTDGAVQAGKEQIEAALERFAVCVETDDWPGYEDRIQEISIPAWAWGKIDEQISEIRGEG